MKLAAFSVAALLSAALAGCGAASSPPDDAEEHGMAPDATLENPLPFMSTVEPGDWSVNLGETDFDAGEEIQADNSQYVEPEDGRQYVTASVTATNIGEGSGVIWEDVVFAYSSSDGELYGETDDDGCPELPNALENQGETSSNDTVAGDVCVSVPSQHAESGMWVVTDTSRPEHAFYIAAR
ncbi:MAG: hypothetical protein ACRDXX_09290 [Stackebrandtia sp.]